MKTIHSPMAVALFVAVGMLSSCSSLPATGDSDADVANMMAKGADRQITIARDEQAKQKLREEIAGLTARPLSSDDAVRIALLNNPDMRATYDEVGIAEADLAQAGRLQNPELSFKRTHGDGQTFIERGLTFNLLNLITAPLAARLEQRRFEAVKQEVAQAGLKLAGDTRAAYIEAVAAKQTAAYMQQVASAAQASRDLALAMRKAGNWSVLDQSRQNVFDAEAENDVARAEHASMMSVQKLARLLGLNPGTAGIRLPDALPPLPVDYPAMQGHLDDAIKARLDVQAAQHRTAWLAQDLGLTKATRFIQVLDLGAVQNRNEGAARAPGYEINLSIPLFDWGTARTQRAEALYLQSGERLAAVVLDAQSEIAAAEENRRSSYQLARRYRDEIVPLRKKISDETLLRYNGMLIGIFELLSDAREQISVTRAYLDATKDYWIADAALQAALGSSDGKLSDSKLKEQP